MTKAFTGIIAAAAIMGSAGVASAADLYTPPPISTPIYSPVPVINWSGVYLGVHGGYGWGSAGASFADGSPLAASLSPNGWLGGAQLGVNWQTTNNLVFGVEGDISAAGLSATYDGPGAGAGPAIVTQKITALASLRARLGYAAGNWLPYVTGGVGFAKGTRDYEGPGGPASASNWHTGWTVGAGVEYAINQNWSIRGEYRYSDFGTKNYAVPGPGGLGTDVHLTTNVATVGLNYKF